VVQSEAGASSEAIGASSEPSNAADDAVTADGTAAGTAAENSALVPAAQVAAVLHAPSLAGSVIEASNGVSGGTPLTRIHNILSTANLGTCLDLKKLALNSNYCPEQY